MGILVQDKVPYTEHSFSRELGYNMQSNENKDEEKAIFALRDEQKLGILNWSSIPLPEKLLSKVTDKKHTSTEDANGFFSVAIFDNEKNYNITDSIRLMHDDYEYKLHVDEIMKTTKIPWLIEVSQEYKLSLNLYAVKIEAQKDLAEKSTKQAFFRIVKKVNTRLRYNNKYKGLASSSAALDANHYEIAGQKIISKTFETIHIANGKKDYFHEIEYDDLENYVGLDQISKYDVNLGSIWIDPVNIIYDRELQLLTLEYSFASDEKQSFARSFPKLPPKSKQTK
eukprot:327852_1